MTTSHIHRVRGIGYKSPFVQEPEEIIETLDPYRLFQLVGPSATSHRRVRTRIESKLHEAEGLYSG